jgi:hypothetical protein
VSVFANGKSILHKGHGKTQLATAPDVCKTPSPGGPVPIPYPNMSADSNLTNGASTVTINDNPVAHTDAQLSRSNGDEAGTAGGVVSSKNMGAFGWSAGSIDVQAEGKGVVRLMDPLLTNGNAYNDLGITIGSPQLGYGDDSLCPRDDCKLQRVIAKHRLPETVKVANMCSEFAAECVAKVPKHMNPGRGPGHMVGVGLCECNQTFKAISGGDLNPGQAGGMGDGFCNTVGIPLDLHTSLMLNSNRKTWKCAALKILSNAGNHKIVALSEKWVGRIQPDGTRLSKTFVKQKFPFPLALGNGTLFIVNIMRRDRILGNRQRSVPSGDSVPSCGKCQAMLPAFICEMKPCAGGGAAN